MWGAVKWDAIHVLSLVSFRSLTYFLLRFSPVTCPLSKFDAFKCTDRCFFGIRVLNLVYFLVGLASSSFMIVSIREIFPFGISLTLFAGFVEP